MLKDLRKCSLDELLKIKELRKQLLELRCSDNWTLKQDNRICDILYNNWGIDEYHPS